MDRKSFGSLRMRSGEKARTGNARVYYLCFVLILYSFGVLPMRRLKVLVK